MNVPHRGLVPPPMALGLCRLTKALTSQSSVIGTNLNCFENLISGSAVF
jgi:hypothetical protein